MVDEKINLFSGGLTVAKKLPKDTGLDNTLKIINEAYTYVPKRLEQFGTKAFETRALGM